MKAMFPCVSCVSAASLFCVSVGALENEIVAPVDRQASPDVVKLLKETQRWDALSENEQLGWCHSLY